MRVDALVPQITEAWQRIAVGEGSKGLRIYDWARTQLPCLKTAGWAQWLLVRRSVHDSDYLAF